MKIISTQDLKFNKAHEDQSYNSYTWSLSLKNRAKIYIYVILKKWAAKETIAQCMDISDAKNHKVWN